LINAGKARSFIVGIPKALSSLVPGLGIQTRRVGFAEEYNKIADLVNLIKSNPDPRELKRALAIKMSIEKQPDKIITQILGVSKSFIRDWKKAFKAEGIAGIKLGYQGAKGKLTIEQKIEIIEWLKNKEYWHLDELTNHLEDKYDVV
jgi:putative transposase